MSNTAAEAAEAAAEISFEQLVRELSNGNYKYIKYLSLTLLSSCLFNQQVVAI